VVKRDENADSVIDQGRCIDKGKIDPHASNRDAQSLGTCDGTRPKWLGPLVARQRSDKG